MIYFKKCNYFKAIFTKIIYFISNWGRVNHPVFPHCFLLLAFHIECVFVYIVAVGALSDYRQTTGQ
jgi:hypothetical protein